MKFANSLDTGFFDTEDLKKIAREVIMTNTWGNENGEDDSPNTLAEMTLALIQSYEDYILGGK